MSLTHRDPTTHPFRCTRAPQFDESGCENCNFLGMKDNMDRVRECTTPYFEGCVAMMDPKVTIP